MTNIEILSLVLGSSLVLRVADHFLTRKVSRNNLEKSRIENIDLAGATWQKTVDRLEERIDKLLGQLKETQEENLKIKEEIYKLQGELSGLKYVQRKAEKYEKRIKELETQISHYEQLLTDNNVQY